MVEIKKKYCDRCNKRIKSTYSSKEKKGSKFEKFIEIFSKTYWFEQLQYRDCNSKIKKDLCFNCYNDLQDWFNNT